MLNQGFTVFVSLIHTCRDFLPAFTVTFTTAPFRTEAAYGCLKPVPTNRLRRTYLHLGYSIVLNEHVLGTSHPWLQGHLSILGHRSNSAYRTFPAGPATRTSHWPGTLPACFWGLKP